MEKSQPLCQEKLELAFRDAMQARFGSLDWLPECDGSIHRFRVPDDNPGTLNGWYVLFPDGIASGAFGSWRTGCSSNWSIRKPANPVEAEIIIRRIEQARHQRQVEQRQRQQVTAVRSCRLWRYAVRADPYHEYLVAKGCKSHHLRQTGDALLIPLCVGRALVNLQRIRPDGSKRFMYGGQVVGAYSPIGRLEPGAPLYVCEGWATGATIHEQNGAAVACAMNAGNLLPAAQRLRRAYPENPLIVAGDDDRQTENNPGRTAANRAAAELGCGVVFPPWCGAEPLSLSDFNDLHQWREANQ